jgi:hypothetical protein
MVVKLLSVLVENAIAIDRYRTRGGGAAPYDSK